MAKSDIGGELAKAVARLVERWVPELSSKYETPNRKDSGGAAFIGTAIWGTGAFVYMTRIDNTISDDMAFASPFVFMFWFVNVLVLVCIISTGLIMKSFDRGRPLTFFFRGLIFPTLALTVLRFAFPS